MTRAPQPETERHPSPALHRIAVAQGGQRVRPFLVTRDDEPAPASLRRRQDLRQIDLRGPGRQGVAEVAGEHPIPGRSATLGRGHLAHGRFTALHHAGQGEPCTALRPARHDTTRIRAAGCSPRRIATAAATSSTPGSCSPGQVGDRPGQPQHLVDAAGTETAPVHGLVDQVQTVRQGQLLAQVGPGHLAVGPPAGVPAGARPAAREPPPPARRRRRRIPPRPGPPSAEAPCAAAGSVWVMSIRSRIGPEMRRRSGGPPSAGTVHCRPGVAARPHGQGLAAITSWNLAG